MPAAWDGALGSMSFDLNGVDALLIAGVSGAGKTTAASLLRRENHLLEP